MASEGKTTVLGVMGSIAVYKIASLASMLKKTHADVEVIMAKNATEFISPVISESLTGKKCLVEIFDRGFKLSVEHTALAKRADMFLIASTSANVAGKTSHGIADDMLATAFLICGCHKIVAPAMDTRMYENPILQDNLKRCESYGMEVLKPTVGYLARGDTGAGKMPKPEMLFDYIVKAVDYEKDMMGRKVLVTVGPTRRTIDLVRFTTDYSIGKTRYAMVKITSLRGADVTFVNGPVSIEASRFVKAVSVENARQMYEAVTAASGGQGIIVKAAAVVDYRPAQAVGEKMKRKDGGLSINLRRTDDVLGYLGNHERDGQFLCGFSMKAQSILENPRMKLSRKHLDMIVANNLKMDGAEFGTDTNVVTIIIGDGELELEEMSKEEVTGRLLDKVMRRTAGPT